MSSSLTITMTKLRNNEVIMTIGLCSWPVFYFVVKKFYLYLTTRKWEIDALFFDDYRDKSKEQPSNNDNWMKTVNKCSFFYPEFKMNRAFYTA